MLHVHTQQNYKYIIPSYSQHLVFWSMIEADHRNLLVCLSFEWGPTFLLSLQHRKLLSKLTKVHIHTQRNCKCIVQFFVPHLAFWGMSWVDRHNLLSSRFWVRRPFSLIFSPA